MDAESMQRIETVVEEIEGDAEARGYKLGITHHRDRIAELEAEVARLQALIPAVAQPAGEAAVLAEIREIVQEVKADPDGDSTPGGVEHTYDFRRLILRWAGLLEGTTK